MIMHHTRLLLQWACTLGLGLSTVSSWSGDTNTWTPYHVTEIRSVTSASISPDGEQIAYLLAVPRNPLEGDDDGPAFVELHVADREGNTRPFITGQVNIGALDWRPDRREISFLAKRQGDDHRALYVIPSDGGESRRLLQHETDISSYSWNPDGNQAAFLALEPEAEELRELKKQGFNQKIYEEDVRPVRVWVAELSAEEKPKPRLLDLDGSASELHWNPVHPVLAVALAPTALVDDSYMRRVVHVVDVETGDVLARLEHPAKLGTVAWSPDGEFLATVSGEDIHDPREGRLFLWNREGEKVRDLLPGYEGHVTSVAWKNVETVVFLASKGTESVVGEVALDGSPASPRLEGGKLIVAAIDLSRDGQTAALVGDSPRHPDELYFLPHGSNEPERLTRSNPWMEEMRFAPQEVVEFTARDGLRLEGVLIRPLDAREGQRYPLILYVHGGPEANISNGWLTSYSAPGQVAAAEGMAVFYPNYRGSTGRGVEFSKLGQADAAGKEFMDLIDAVDHFVETGLVDGDRVGITGGSYGGYASAWGATYYSDRFAAAVMFVGISNNLSKVGTTDIPFEMYAVHHRKWLWEDWDYFLKRSPIYYVNQARTPLLILHGEEDPRVHPSQSLELYRHLKLLEKAPVRLVLYPGEGHGNRRAASRLDYNLRMLRWMKHYLTGEGGDPPPYTLTYEPESEAGDEGDREPEE